MREVAPRIGRFFAFPYSRLFSDFEGCLDRGGLRALAAVFVGLALGWWIYVPVHELLHVAGCVLPGGTVELLEVDPLYGGRLLEGIFPFVAAGGEYAGRLSGFETGGSDLVYLSTVLAPWIVVFVGAWISLAAGRARRAVLWGAALPWSLAPLLSLTGDALESGGILVTRLAPWKTELVLRSDDLFRTLGEIDLSDPGLVAGLVLAQLIGALLAATTIAAAFLLAERFLPSASNRA